MLCRVVCPAPSRAPQKVACNSPRSVFDTAHKRCNSNDPISMFEIVARELHATLLRNHGTGTRARTEAGTGTRAGTRARTEAGTGTRAGAGARAGAGRVPKPLLAPKVACNSPGSVFNTAHKRCNSNDAISMFEIVARELHATLLRNHGTTTAGMRRPHSLCGPHHLSLRGPRPLSASPGVAGEGE